MRTKATRAFIESAGLLLVAIAGARIVSNWASAGLTQPHDPLLMIPMRTLCWIVALIELAVALVCLVGRRPWLQLILVWWLAAGLSAYLLALFSAGTLRGSSVYLDRLANAFGIAPETAGVLLIVSVVYLLAGSSGCMVWFWAENKGHVKNTCVYCHGRVEFPRHGAGQRIPCPHCSAMITLQLPSEKSAGPC